MELRGFDWLSGCSSLVSSVQLSLWPAFWLRIAGVGLRLFVFFEILIYCVSMSAHASDSRAPQHRLRALLQTKEHELFRGDLAVLLRSARPPQPSSAVDAASSSSSRENIKLSHISGEDRSLSLSMVRLPLFYLSSFPCFVSRLLPLLTRVFARTNRARLFLSF